MRNSEVVIVKQIAFFMVIAVTLGFIYG